MRAMPGYFAASLLILTVSGCSRLMQTPDQSKNQILSALLLPQTSCSVGGLVFLATDSACEANSGIGSGWLIAPADGATILSLQIAFRLDTDGELALYGGGNRANLSRTAARMVFSTTGSSAHHFDDSIGADMGYAVGADPRVYCLEIDSGQIPPQLLARDLPCPSGTGTVSDATFNSVDAGLPGSSAAPGAAWGLKLTRASIQWILMPPSRIFNP